MCLEEEYPENDFVIVESYNKENNQENFKTKME